MSDILLVGVEVSNDFLQDKIVGYRYCIDFNRVIFLPKTSNYSKRLLEKCSNFDDFIYDCDTLTLFDIPNLPRYINTFDHVCIANYEDFVVGKYCSSHSSVIGIRVLDSNGSFKDIRIYEAQRLINASEFANVHHMSDLDELPTITEFEPHFESDSFYTGYEEDEPLYILKIEDIIYDTNDLFSSKQDIGKSFLVGKKMLSRLVDMF